LFGLALSMGGFLVYKIREKEDHNFYNGKITDLENCKSSLTTWLTTPSPFKITEIESTGLYPNTN
jgi:hypothetical protein